ncbi:hypothetical protein CG001_02325 [Mesoplasma coleopterae]|uniref:DnaA ATPase domain-containing protein n=1 Tax=Mesoplasma coleopterae TaxID=324078 RepID=UPI000D022B24|nr:DnaA/Hda family protein [Mesoplasma coleopterae]AVN62464.1 hypothetical protein CG001_02325 [Mesoplasma coleopterae]
MKKLFKNYNKENGVDKIDLVAQKNTDIIDSDDSELVFKYLKENFSKDNKQNEPNNWTRPILIAGNSGLGKTHLINDVCEKLKIENESDFYYINCKEFMNTINEEKGDYFKIFINKIANKMSGKKTYLNSNEKDIKRNIILTFLSIFTLPSFITLFVEYINFTNNPEKHVPNWLIGLWIFFIFLTAAATVLFGTLTLIELFKKNSEKKFQKIVRKRMKNKANKSFIIFDDLNRLAKDGNDFLSDLERKFIKEISSIQLENLVYIFITSNSVFDANSKNEEYDFSKNYFSKIFKLQKNEKIYSNFSIELNQSHNFSEAYEREIWETINNVLEKISYRDAKTIISNFAIYEKSWINIDPKSFLYFAFIKYFSIYDNEINNKVEFIKNDNQNGFIKEDGKLFYNYFYKQYHFEGSIDKKSIVTELLASEKDKNSSIKDGFSDNKHVLKKLNEWKSASEEEKRLIEEILYKMKKTGTTFPNLNQWQSSLIKDYEPKNQYIFSISKPSSHSVFFYDEKIRDVYAKNNFDNYLNLKPSTYWIDIWLMVYFKNAENKKDFVISVIEKMARRSIIRFSTSIEFIISIFSKDYFNWIFEKFDKTYLHDILHKTNENISDFYSNIDSRISIMNLNDHEKKELKTWTLIFYKSYNVFTFSNLHNLFRFYDKKDKIKILEYMESIGITKEILHEVEKTF